MLDWISEQLVVHAIASGRRTTIALPPAGIFGYPQLGWLGDDALVLSGAVLRGTQGWLARLEVSPDGVVRVPEALLGAGEGATFAVENVAGALVLVSRIVIDRRLEVRSDGRVDPAPSALADARPMWASPDGTRFLASGSSGWFYVDLPGWRIERLPIDEDTQARIVSAQSHGASTIGIMTDQTAHRFFELDGERLTTRDLPGSLVGPRARCRGDACVVYGADERVVEVHAVTPTGFEGLVRVEPEGGIPGGQLAGFDVSADRRRVVFTTPAYRMFLVDVATGAARELIDPECAGPTLVRFSSDDRGLLYVCLDRTYLLRSRDLATGATRSVLSDSSIATRAFEPLPNGLLISQQTRAGKLEIVEAR
jgi:hypothetical protein